MVDSNYRRPTFMREQLRILVCFAIFLPPSSVMAAEATAVSSRYIRTTYGYDKIPSLIIQSITQSQQGFLWMVDGGQRLMRFDGQSFYEVSTPLAESVALAPNGD